MNYFSGNISAIRTGKWFTFSLAMIFHFIPLSSFAQVVNVTAAADRSDMLIGDQITIHLEINQPGDIMLRFDEHTDTLTDGIEILLQSDFDTTLLEGNRISIKKDFLITCFDSGTYIIPPFKATLMDTTASATFRSDPIYLTVARTDIEPADSTVQIFDIKEPYGAPVTFREVLPYVLGGLLFVGLATFLIHYLKKRKKEEPILKRVEPAEPAHVIALRELDKLKSEKLWQQEKVKMYYSRLTEILRTYLENRYGIQAMEQTSSETLQALLGIGFNDNNLFDTLKEIFFLADMAKFAKAKPLPNENETSLLSSYLFVNETKEAWKKRENQKEEEGEPTEEKMMEHENQLRRMD